MTSRLRDRERDWSGALVGGCDCNLCRRSRAFDLALYTGNVRDLDGIYDAQFEAMASLEMDLAHAVDQLHAIVDHPSLAADLAQRALEVLGRWERERAA